MRNALFGLAAFVVPLSMGCSAVSSPPGSEGATMSSTSTTMSTPPPDPTSTATGPMCGGFAGIACPAGLVCVDDPRDSCDPTQGGADCSGVCVPQPDGGSPGGDGGSPGPGCDKPGRKYMGRTADICSRIRYFCEPGSVAFHDDCGCGCEPDSAAAPGPTGVPTKAGAKCGKSTCGPTEYCCNPSCGICAPKDGACTQQVCD